MVPFALQLSSMPMSEDSLEDLTELVGPELANLVHGNVHHPIKVTTSSSNSTPFSDMPADISDLRSSDLLPTFPDIDIDRIFAEFQAEHSNNSVRRWRLTTIYVYQKTLLKLIV